jgi:hypothetical protein
VKKLPNKFQEGFIDPISMIALGFLVVSLIVGTTVVIDRTTSFDIREEAKIVTETVDKKIGTIPTKTSAPTPTQTNKPTPKRSATKPPTPTPTPSPSQTPQEQDKLEEKLNISEKSPIPSPTPYCSSFLNIDCQYGCTPTVSGGECKSKPTPTPLSEEESRLAEKLDIPSPTPKPTPYCSSFLNIDCQYGCTPTVSGGECREGSATTAQTPLKANGETCNRDSECQSGQCYYQGFGQSICVVPASTEFQTDEEQLIALGQFLNKVTFGSFGNYVSTNVGLNEQYSDAGFWERRLNQESLAAATELGTVVTAEGAVLVGGGYLLAGGSVPALSTTVLPTLESASLTAYSYATATLTTALASAPNWVPQALRFARYGLVGLGNWGVIHGVQACQDDPSSFECSSLIASGQLGLLDDLAQETGSALDDIGQAVSNTLRNYVTEQQKLYAFSQNVVNPRGLGDNITPTTDISLSSSSDDVILNQIDEATNELAEVTLESTGETITLGEQLGESGAQGTAFISETCTGETCVVKLLDQQTNVSNLINQNQINFLNQSAAIEAETIAQGGYQTLPVYYGTVTDDAGNAVGYAMQYIEGEVGWQLYEAQGGLTHQQATAIFDTISEFQTRYNLPHGDIANNWLNLGNVIITPEGNAVLIDPALTSLAERQGIQSVTEFMRVELENARAFLQGEIIN